MSGLVTATVAELTPYINWSFYFAAWGVPGTYPAVFSHPGKGATARSLYDDAREMLRALEGRITPSGIATEFPARACGDGIVLETPCGQRLLPMHRDPATGYCVADFVARSGGRATLFAFTAGTAVAEICSGYRRALDDYSAFSVKFLADRLVEAFADKELPTGCRFGVGYPAIPDHSLKRDILDIIDPGGALGLSLTETCMIVPAETVCGIWLSNARYPV